MAKELMTINQNNTGAVTGFASRLSERSRQVKGQLCLLDARFRTVMAQPDEGAATAEYAVVLVAATGFAAVLVALLKSGAVKALLMALVKKALKVV
ncbi:DUF4244 domain-containing protein [Bifidobacterium sp. ESL0798]|uniref:DUF4244 domain-containing protein n=1 Tax=unclassified Bifidobacterium TaxID=2608897 RepID=UPI0023F93C0D|nr:MULTISPECIES: DUF4244 domain-containing protein [unclassified Bifidobacterium]WEV53299.1 DUF4244 domain-containing protein [Bifidobacterium sp. ESL0704]WEV73728.1 DUF4244 domain-containing protein [Bifidobacterium sp. ESL0798]